MTVQYPDLSNYDFERGVPVLEGTRLIIARASLSTSYIDPSYDWWRREAVRVGAMFAAYHWMNHGNIAAQAAWFAKAAGPVPMVLDVEDVPGETGYNGTMEVGDVVSMVVALRALGANPRAFYLPHWYWERMGKPDLRPIADLGIYMVASDYRFAYSDTSPAWSAYGGVEPTFLQYTNHHEYSPGGGYSSYNAFRGSLEALRAVLGGEGGAMASQAYFNWVKAGRPVTGVARPLARLRDRLRAYGYTVYDMGNDAHLKAVPPEDHCPFSATGWPIATPHWWITAIDIMPPAAGKGLPSLAQLGAQLLDDKKAGFGGAAFLKYMNWEPSGSGGPCYHEKFTPGYVRTSSTDRGHIHVSSRSDVVGSTASDNYDPVARLRRGGGSVTTTGGDMLTWGKCTKEFGDAVLVGNGVERRAVKNWANSSALASVHGLPTTPPDYPTKEALFEVLGWVDADETGITTVTLEPGDIEALGAELAQVVFDHPGVSLSPEALAAVGDALKAKLAEMSFNVTAAT